MTHSFVAPLLLSPVIAIAMAGALYVPLRKVRRTLGVTKQTCVCVGNPLPQLVQLRADSSAVLLPSRPDISAGQVERCVERYQGQFVGVDAQTCVDGVHYASAGAVCFSRAVNDTPKVAALLLATQAWNSSWVVGLVAAIVFKKKIFTTKKRRARSKEKKAGQLVIFSS